VTPVANLFFWFGDLVVYPPAWLIVFTGKGQSTQSPLVENGRTVYFFYWNLENTIFNIPGFVPVVFKIDSILIGHNVLPADQRQIANPVAKPEVTG
jgi:hypothetical protein